MAYKPDAIQKAYDLFARGLSHEDIEREMKADYPSWSRQLLYGPDGWIQKYGWEARRAKADAKRQELTDAIASTEELMVRALTSALGSLTEKIESAGSLVKAEDVTQLNKISSTLNTIRKRMAEGGSYDRAAVFLEFLKELVSFLAEKDQALAEATEEYLDEFIERVKGRA